MFNAKSAVLCFLMAMVFFSCGSSPSSGGNSGASMADAQAAAQAALDRMDGKQPSSPGSGLGSGSAVNQPAQNTPSGQSAPSAQQQGPVVNTSRTKPAWVDSADSVYSRSLYIAAVGYASDRTMAEKNALASLVAFFGQSVKADQTIVNTYHEAVRNGVTAGWTDNIAMQNTIQTSASMDTVVGAEIKEVWYDSKSTYYAVAVMEKAKTAEMYVEMIKANQNMIGNLIDMTPAQKNTIEGFTRYQFAGTVADINTSYVNLLRLIDSPPPAGLKTGNDYRLEAQEIVKTIPIGVTVKNDKSGRIQGAFAKILSDLGFRSGGSNSRYVLQVDINISPVDLPSNSNKFVRIEMGANLTDAATRSVLLPYNFNSREGHISETEAENRAYMAAERKINEEYKGILSDYLSQILPKR